MAKSAASSLNNFTYTGGFGGWFEANYTATGSWEDVKDYNTVMVTVGDNTYPFTMTFQWANTAGRTLPVNDDILCTDVIVVPGTIDNALNTYEKTHRGRWFRLRIDGIAFEGGSNELRIRTMHKGHTSHPSIVDADGTAVDVNLGSERTSLLTLLHDASGAPLKTDLYGDAAVLTSIKDHPLTQGIGDADKSLIVVLRDGDHALPTGDTLLVHPSNSVGYSQAGTTELDPGSVDHAGRSLFLSLTDVSQQLTTTKSGGNNAMYVTLTLNGMPVGLDNPLPATTDPTANTVAATYFDISTGITANNFYTHTDISSTSANLFNLFTYNDGAVPVWTKLYDMSAGFIRDDVSVNASRYFSKIRLNVTTPPGTYRDLKFPKGLNFDHGLWFRTTTEPQYDSSLSPGDAVLFVNGSFYRPAPVVLRSAAFESDHIANVSEFPGGLTGLEDLAVDAAADPDAIDMDFKTIDFKASGYISGSVTFSYNSQEQLLSLTTVINNGDVKAMSFNDGQQDYDIDLSNYKLKVPLTTDNINITPEQLMASRLNIILTNDMLVSVTRNLHL